MLRPVLLGPHTFVWDLAITAEGPKIYEFQAYEDSYFGGYQKVTDDSLNNRVENSWRVNGGEVRSDLLRSCAHNKIICASLLGPELLTLFPKQKTYADDNYLRLAANIAADFEGSEGVVIKTPKGNRAEGVRILSVDELKTKDIQALSELFPANTSSHSNGMICYNVQEAQKPAPINVAGTYYRPTVRLVATVSPFGNGDITWNFHGAYYKLPLDGFASRQAAQAAPIHSKQSSSAISKGFNDNNEGAAKLPDDVYATLCEAMQTQMQAMFMRMRSASSIPYIERALNSDNEGDVIAALNHLAYYEPTCGSDFEDVSPLSIPKIRDCVVDIVQSQGLARTFINNMCEAGIGWAQELRQQIPPSKGTTGLATKRNPG